MNPKWHSSGSITLSDTSEVVADVAAKLARTLSAGNFGKLLQQANRETSAVAYLSSMAADCRQLEQRLVLQSSASKLGLDCVDLRASEVAMAVAAARRQMTATSLEVVWTGPASVASGMRGTEQVLLEVIDSAKRELLVVVYAAFDIRNIVAAIDRAIARGVVVTVVVESLNPKTGEQKPNFMASFSEPIRTRSRLLHWPLATRDTDENGRPGCLHAKVAVGDREVVFVTSANLTGSAMRENMEMGLRVDNFELGEQVVAHFERMRDDGVLVQPT